MKRRFRKEISGRRKGISRQQLLIMTACVDIWAMLFVLQRNPDRFRDVSLVISNREEPPGFAHVEPLQVWVTGTALGVWPRTKQPLSVEEVKAYLRKHAENSRCVELRLLVDPALSLRQWGRIALELSPHAEDIRVAPLPRAPRGSKRRDERARTASK